MTAPGVAFQHRRLEWRTLRSALLSSLTWALAAIACVPLFSVLYMLVVRGGARLNWEALTALPPAAFEVGGGFGNAIAGTAVMVGMGALLSVPAGILIAIYTAELGPSTLTTKAARFCAKTLTGLPSILAGVFAYAAVVLVTGSYSAWAGGIALALLMIPTVVLSAEEALRMVPRSMREAAVGMGCNPTQTIFKVVLPTAWPAVQTGVLLAVARASGETAPLLFTALFSDYWLRQGGEWQLMEPTASLAVLIYNYSGMPFDNQIELAWAASLVLVALILTINIVSRLLSRLNRGVAQR